MVYLNGLERGIRRNWSIDFMGVGFWFVYYEGYRCVWVCWCDCGLGVWRGSNFLVLD